MSRRKVTLLSLSVLLIGLGIVAFAWWINTSGPADPDTGVRIKLRVDGARESVRLLPTREGGYVFVLSERGAAVRLTPDQLAERLFEQERGRDWLGVVFNITSPIGLVWIGLGLLGQVLFTGRMIVQWIVSERSKRSVVPVAFWWMSLIGASMLLTYFIWRNDIVGVLGQSTGFVIYLRNLILIAGQRDGEALDPNASDAPQ